VPSDGSFLANRVQIMRASLRNALPTIVGNRESLEAGALLNYSVDFPETRRQLVVFIDKILRGAKPADLPIEQPTKFEIGINLKTANALRLTIPQSLLLQADQVIQ
jgi:putative ABC transport system substrate-binding protein